VSVKKSKRYYSVTIRAMVIEEEEETFNICAETPGEAIKQAMNKFEVDYVIDYSSSIIEIEVEK
jgi:hypothetical protein